MTSEKVISAEEYSIIMIGMEIAEGVVGGEDSPKEWAEKIMQRLKETGISVIFTDDSEKHKCPTVKEHPG